MKMKSCWVCEKEIPTSSVGYNYPPTYSEVRLVQINRPYSTNSKTRHIYVCENCTIIKLGLSPKGENLNVKIAKD